MLDEAFAALDRGELNLARKLSLRARQDGSMNPRVLHDHAELMLELGDLEEAEDALRAAIALAPNYAEAFAALAALQAHGSKWAAAARLQARVVELRPDDGRAATLLADYRTMAAQTMASRTMASRAMAASPERRSNAADPGPDIWGLEGRAAALDVHALAGALAQHGHAAAPLLSPAECAELRGLLDSGDGPGLDRIVSTDAAEAGSCHWRYFLVPPPLPVAALRRALFVPAAALANAMRQRLGDAADFPAARIDWPRAQLGRSTSRWIGLPEHGCLPAARADDRRAFPLRAILDLGPGDTPVDSVSVEDQRHGRKVRRSAAGTRAGDVVFAACRDRLVAVGGVPGLQPVRYGVGPVRAGRQLLDLDFDGP